MTVAQTPHDDLLTRVSELRQQILVQVARVADTKSKLQATYDHFKAGTARDEWARLSALGRMQARLDTMPVIEQAKGVLMARFRCTPDEAFELLRRASQKSNVKVNVLAERIVREASAGRLDLDGIGIPARR